MQNLQRKAYKNQNISCNPPGIYFFFLQDSLVNLKKERQKEGRDSQEVKDSEKKITEDNKNEESTSTKDDLQVGITFPFPFCTHTHPNSALLGDPLQEVMSAKVPEITFRRVLLGASGQNGTIWYGQHAVANSPRDNFNNSILNVQK